MIKNSDIIDMLRQGFSNEDELAADLLEMHDRKSLSLDKWISATDFVQQQVRAASGLNEWVVAPNGA
jgi:hypothetical protein